MFVIYFFILWCCVYPEVLNNDRMWWFVTWYWVASLLRNPRGIVPLCHHECLFCTYTLHVPGLISDKYGTKRMFSLEMVKLSSQGVWLMFRILKMDGKGLQLDSSGTVLKPLLWLRVLRDIHYEPVSSGAPSRSKYIHIIKDVSWGWSRFLPWIYILLFK